MSDADRSLYGHLLLGSAAEGSRNAVSPLQVMRKELRSDQQTSLKNEGLGVLQSS